MVLLRNSFTCLTVSTSNGDSIARNINAPPTEYATTNTQRPTFDNKNAKNFLQQILHFDGGGGLRFDCFVVLLIVVIVDFFDDFI